MEANMEEELEPRTDWKKFGTRSRPILIGIFYPVMIRHFASKRILPTPSIRKWVGLPIGKGWKDVALWMDVPISSTREHKPVRKQPGVCGAVRGNDRCSIQEGHRVMHCDFITRARWENVVQPKKKKGKRR